MSEKSDEKRLRRALATYDTETAAALGAVALERMALRQHVGKVCAEAAYGLSQEVLSQERGFGYAALNQDPENPESQIVGIVIVALNPGDAQVLLEIARQLKGETGTERTITDPAAFGGGT